MTPRWPEEASGGGGGGADPSDPSGWPTFYAVGTGSTISAAGTYSVEIRPSDAPTVYIGAGLVITAAYVAQASDVGGAEIRLNGGNAVRLSGAAVADLPVTAWNGVSLGGSATFSFEPGATSTKRARVIFTLGAA